MKDLDFIQGLASYLFVYYALYAGTWTVIGTPLEIQVIHLFPLPFQRSLFKHVLYKLWLPSRDLKPRRSQWFILPFPSKLSRFPMSWLFRDSQSEHWVPGAHWGQLAGSPSEQQEKEMYSSTHQCQFKIALISRLRRKELENYHTLNSYRVSLWGKVDLQDPSVEWDSVTPGEGLAPRLSVKFPAPNDSLSLKLNLAQVCLPEHFLIRPSPRSRKREFIFNLRKSQVWT